MGRGEELPGLGNISDESLDLLCTLKRGAHHNLWSWDYTFPWRNRSRKLFSRWNVCAVVSSGGVLNQYEYGPLIDKADLVMRFNGAPSDGFEQYVGRKTDMRVVNNEYFKHVWSLGYAPLAVAKQYPLQEFSINISTSYACVWDDWSDAFHYWDFMHMVSSSHHEVELDLLQPSVHESLTRDIKSIYEALNLSGIDGESWIPSTGALGMYAALVICDQVYAFGMAGTTLSEMAANHYYEPWSVKPTWHKTWDLEKDLWKRLASNPPGWSVESTDVSIIPGLSHITCPGDEYPIAFKEVPQPPSPESFIVRVSLVTFLPLALYITVRLLARPGNNSRSSGKTDVRVVGALAVYTCFVVSTHVYAQLAARRNGGQAPWDVVAMLMLREAFKGAVSAALFLLEARHRAAPEAGSTALRTNSISTDDGSEDGDEAQGTYVWLAAGLRLLPLAAAYSLSDLWVACLTRGMQMREYLVWTNASVVFSALAWVCLFRRCLPGQQWLGLGFLLLGGLLRQFPLERRGPLSLKPAEIWGMLFAPLVSSLANAANESILKDPVFKNKLGLNCLNLILYTEAFVVIFASHVFFRTWLGGRYAWETPLEAPIWIMVLMNAATGLALSRVLAYDEFGTVSKVIAGGTRHIADAMLSPIWMSTLFYVVCNVCSSLWVTCSICVFFLPWFRVSKREMAQLQDVHMRLYDDGNE